MSKKTNIRSVGLAAVPIFIYATGGVTVLRNNWGESCSVPCFKVINYATVKPIKETWIIVGQYFGHLGQVIFIVVMLVWILYIFTIPVLRRSYD